ncbi:hypothetical protein [Rubripirellula tenax]|uniref:hypothetical protein n=1 Tax=Rubripirellula tenax TaxID=2528015 RepID=UPI0011B672E0|nr:hypothetical protein [Rubripirellula tenax]
MRDSSRRPTASIKAVVRARCSENESQPARDCRLRSTWMAAASWCWESNGLLESSVEIAKGQSEVYCSMIAAWNC